MEAARPKGPELYHGPTVPILGETDIYDARRALRQRVHPQGWRPEPIWAARYARACVDMLAGHIKILGGAIRIRRLVGHRTKRQRPRDVDAEARRTRENV